MYSDYEYKAEETYFPAHQKDFNKIKAKLSQNTKVNQEEINDDLLDLLGKMLHTIGKLEARSNSYSKRSNGDD
jgi:hypothetical protein